MPQSSAINELIALSGQMFDDRKNLLQFWQESAELFYPERADFTSTRSYGTVQSDLMESSPPLFRRDFANFLGSILRPKGRNWWKFVPDDETIGDTNSARRWLDNAEKQTWSILRNPHARFIRTMNEADNDYACFGNSVTSLRERDDRQGLIYQSWHLRDCAWAENSDGDVDTLHRKFKEQARNVVRRQGWDVHPRVKEMLTVAKTPFTKVNFVQIDMPSDQQDIIPKQELKGRPWCCFIIDIENSWLVYSKAVAEFPYMVSRWHTISGSPYAYSPCAIVGKPDAQTMQDMTRVILEAGEKAVNPPMIAQQQAVLGGVNIYAGGVTWADKNYDERTGETLRALQLGGEPKLGMLMRQDVREVLNSAWFLNKLFLPQQGQMTAEEIDKRNQEFLRVSQPIVEPAEPERNGLTLDLTMRMALRIGYYGPLNEMPEELQGQMIGFEYDNPIADVRKSLNTMQFRQTVGLAIETSQVDKGIGDILNVRDGFRAAAEGIGAPAEWLKDDDEMAQIDAENAKKAQIQQGIETANAGGVAATNVGKGVQALTSPVQALQPPQPEQLAARAP